jgi:hypothetical protein
MPLSFAVTEITRPVGTWVTVTGTPPTRLPVSSVISMRIEEVVCCAWTWVEIRTVVRATREMAII